MSVATRPPRALINSGRRYTPDEVDAALHDVRPPRQPSLWQHLRMVGSWLVLLAGLAGILALLGSPASQPPAPHAVETAPAVPGTVRVPIVAGNWLVGYRETPQSCLVRLMDELPEVARLGSDLVARYTPLQADPALCPPGTLVLFDTWDQMLLSYADATKEVHRMLQRRQ